MSNSVEWLFLKLWNTPKDKLNWNAILQQAKEMHNEEIEDVELRAKEIIIIKHTKHSTPIELPSDEEIDVHIEDDFINASEVHKYSKESQLLMKSMCKVGAKWMRDKIGGNK